MDFNSKNIRTFSILGQRGAFGTALLDLAEENEDIVALSADLCNTSGLDRFQKKFPDRFINTGIAEQNMLGIAAGLAAGGKIPFATTFANFAALRSCEQVRHFMGYMCENVKLVGFGAGFSMGMFGTTHYAVEDIAALRAINNLIILSPADGLETVKATAAAVRINAPVYLRLSGTMNNPIVYKEDFNFEIGKANLLREGKDIFIFATGTMVHTALCTADTLEQRGLSVSVVDVCTIQPVDTQMVQSACDAKLIVTMEEHSVVGGLGSAIAEELSLKIKRPPHLMIGTQPSYLKAGDFNYMLEQHGLTYQKTSDKILTFFKGVS